MGIVSEIFVQLDRTEYTIVFGLRYKKRTACLYMCMGKLQLILDSVRNSISDPASVITAVKLGWLKIDQSLKGWEGGNELSAGKNIQVLPY